MDHIKVLKRAWHIVWNYRVLWVFGVILALTTAGGGYGGNGGGGGGNGGNNGGDWFPFENFQWPELTHQTTIVLIVAGVVLLVTLVLLSLAAAVARYVAETALMQMVDRYEETGEKLGVRQGFRLGWSRTAWRLFLIGLLVSLPAVAAFILLLTLALAPLLLWLTKITVIGVLGTVATIGMLFLSVFLAIVVGVLLSLLIKFFWRACALENLGVTEAIRRGFAVAADHWQDVLVMWLIMMGVGIAWAILLVVLLLFLFPVILLLIVVGGVLGGIPALIVWAVAQFFANGALPWILAALVGIPIFVMVLALPFLFLNGLMKVFESSAWTLTYRELLALEALE